MLILERKLYDEKICNENEQNMYIKYMKKVEDYIDIVMYELEEKP